MDKNTIINQVVNESYNNLTSLVEIRTLGLLRGGMHMKKRVYVIKFLNRLCIIMLIIALMLLIIKIDICL